MRRQSLRAKGARKYKATTNSKHSLRVAPNLLEQDFSAVRPSQKWVSDITYIATDERWLSPKGTSFGAYLAVVLDLYSRVVVGWLMSERMTASLICDALRMPLFRRQRPSGVIVHSDRGSQYWAASTFKCNSLIAKASISSAKASDGVFQPRVFRGRLFINRATDLAPGKRTP